MNYIFLDYPKHLNQVNIYLNRNFNADNNAFEMLFQNMNAPDVEKDTDGMVIDYPKTLANFLTETCGGRWALADENQQGMRGWFEFSSGETLGAEQVAMIYLRSERFDEMTNNATKRESILSHRIQTSMGRYGLYVREVDGDEYHAGSFDTKEAAEAFFRYYIARDPSKTIVSD